MCGVLRRNKVNINSFKISSIESIKFIDTNKRITQRNIPYAIQVSHRKFKNFCRWKNLQSELVTFADRMVYRDEYKNTVAVIMFGYCEPNKYYINPKLYSIGQEQQKHIENVYAQVESSKTIYEDNNPKTLEISYD